MPNDLDDLIDWLDDVHDDLSSPQPFFNAHEDRYLEISRRVATQTLLSQRPPDVDHERWLDDTHAFAELIFSRPLAPGLEIAFAHRTELDRLAGRNLSSKPDNFTPITYADVLEWVLAGPENGGKDITAIESARDRSPEQIAFDVHNAIRQHRLGFERKDFSRITQRLEDWVNSRMLAGDMDQILIAVLDAWIGTLLPIVERDFNDWLDRDVLGRI